LKHVIEARIDHRIYITISSDQVVA